MEVNDLQIVTPQTEPGGVGNTALESVSGVHDPQPAGQSDYEIARPLSRQPILHHTIRHTLTGPAAGSVGPVMLGFHAKSFRYDNVSGMWIYLNDPGISIPPYSFGGVVNVPSGLSVVRIQFGPAGGADPGVAPFGVPVLVASAPVAGQWFTFDFYSKHQPPCPPSSLNITVT